MANIAAPAFQRLQEYIAIGVFAVVYALIIGRNRFGIPIWAAMRIGAALMIGLQVIIIEATESRGVQAFSFVEFFKVGSMVTAVNLAIYFAFIVLI